MFALSIGFNGVYIEQIYIVTKLTLLDFSGIFSWENEDQKRRKRREKEGEGRKEVREGGGGQKGGMEKGKGERAGKVGGKERGRQEESHVPRPTKRWGSGGKTSGTQWKA